MSLSRGEIAEIGKATAQAVLEGLHRYAVEYKDPETIEDGLRDSMVEELTAADWYRQRAVDSRLVRKDEETAKLYEHVAQEEERHYYEFNQRLSKISTINDVTRAINA